MAEPVYHSGVSIAAIVLYVPALLVAIHLTVRRGYGSSSSWYYLIIFTIVRIPSSAFQLASVSRSTDTSLYSSYGTLDSMCLCLLELAALNLLSRVLQWLKRNSNRRVYASPIYLWIVQVLVLVAMIMNIVGGDKAKKGDVDGAHSLEDGATRLILIVFGNIVIAIVQTFMSIVGVECVERRLLYAVTASLPFFIVRLVYAGIKIYGYDARFNPITGSVTIYLLMVLLMELAIVVIFEGIGLTLGKIPQEERPRTESDIGMDVRNGRTGEDDEIARS